jgi:putative oxidoreductase
MSAVIFPAVVEGRGAVGLLVLRVIAGAAFLIHGWGKIEAGPIGWMGPEAPTPAVLQGLSTAAEFLGGAGWILGFFTPLASLGIFINMMFALQYHLSLAHPFVNPAGASYELALVYWAVALLLLLIGPGRYSLDARFVGGWRG